MTQELNHDRVNRKRRTSIETDTRDRRVDAVLGGLVALLEKKGIKRRERKAIFAAIELLQQLGRHNVPTGGFK
jgi:hypothetical protein